MAEPFVGEIRLFPFSFAPKNFALCNGQLLPINQNQALFSLLGTTYGGDGRTTFGLPNLQGRVALGFDSGAYPQGALGGETNHTLTVSELATHNHPAVVSNLAVNAVSPVNNYPCTTTNGGYSSSPATNLGTGSNATGGGQAHANEQPYLVLSYCIALFGIFPSRN